MWAPCLPPGVPTAGMRQTGGRQVWFILSIRGMDQEVKMEPLNYKYPN